MMQPEAIAEQMSINRRKVLEAVRYERAAVRGYRAEVLRLMGPADGTDPEGAELVLRQYDAALARYRRAADAATF